MKSIFKIGLLVALLTCAGVAFGQQNPATDGLLVHSSGGTVVGTTLYYGVISANGKNSGAPLVTGISGKSASATAKIQFYNITNSTAANFVSTTTSVPVVSTNGFSINDIIVIRHLYDDTYERRVVTTFTSATNLTVTAAPTVALAVGDIVYKALTSGTLVWGAATNTIQGPGIWAGQGGKPLLFEIDCSAAADGGISGTAVFAK